MRSHDKQRQRPRRRADLFLPRGLLRPSRPSQFWALSGKSLDGGLGGTRDLSRKMHFLFLISFPQRNLDRFNKQPRMKMHVSSGNEGSSVRLSFGVALSGGPDYKTQGDSGERRQVMR